MIFIITKLFIIIIFVFIGNLKLFSHSNNFYSNKLANNLSKNAEFLEDKGNQLSFKEIKDPKLSKRFVKNNKEILNLGFTKSTIWIRFRLSKLPSDSKEKWLLEIPYPPLDYVELYIPISSDQFIRKIGGDKIPFKNWEIKNNYVLFPLPQRYDNNQYFYLRFQTQSTMQLSINILTEKTFNENKLLSNFGYGLFYGIVAVMVIYNLFLFIFIRDINYLYYISYIVSYIFYQASFNGFTFQFLLPDSPDLANILNPFLSGLAIFCGLLFTKSFLQTKLQTPILHKVIIFLMMMCIFQMISAFTLDYSIGIQLSAYLGLLFSLSVLPTAIIIYRKGYNPARFFLIAWTFLLISLFLFVLRGLGFLQGYFITTHGIELGVILEVILLSLALADRVNMMRQETISAQEDAYKKLIEIDKMKDTFVETLEHQVLERTQELQESEQRYRQLVELSPDCVVVHREEKILFVNNSTVKLISATSYEDLIGKNIFNYIHPQYHSTAINAVKDIIANDQPSLSEYKLISIDGKIIDVEAIFNIVIFQGKRAVLTIVHDISNRKRIERLREDTERILKHDLRNPLHGIIGFSEILLKSANLIDRQKKEINHIKNNGYQMLKMINHSLDIFKMEEGTYQFNPIKCDLIDILYTINNELDHFSSHSHILFYFNNQIIDFSKTFEIHGEYIHLKTLFSNLIKNALEASPVDREVTVNIWVSENNIKIDIHNWGVIPDSIRNYIFQRYVTKGKLGGTGLGCYSANLISKIHRGDIFYSTSEEDGTNFIITLPIKLLS